mgnify:CR=1 FL=1
MGYKRNNQSTEGIKMKDVIIAVVTIMALFTLLYLLTG